MRLDAAGCRDQLSRARPEAARASGSEGLITILATGLNTNSILTTSSRYTIHPFKSHDQRESIRAKGASR